MRRFGLVFAAAAVVWTTLVVAPAKAHTNCRIELPTGHRHHNTCTHGGDPAPPGVDPHHRDPVPLRLARADNASGAMTAAGSGQVPCFGDGTSGNRVEAIYAVPAGTADRFNVVSQYIPSWAAAADQVFATSASETGGVRHVRWVTDASCNLVMHHVQLSSTGADEFANTIDELQAKGYTRPDRKYLVWIDADVYCGIGEVYNDDSASNNANNGGDAMFARVDNGCWGVAGQSVEAHELMHTLGGVQQSAPHATVFNHCWDLSDVMCYADGSGAVLQNLCPSSHANVFDCNHDDYFSTNATASSYLGKKWNTANSSFLAITAPPPTWHLASAGAPPGGLTGGLAVTSWATGRLDVFGRSAVDNSLWHAAYNAGVWQAWESLGGVITSAPATASWSAGRLDVFARGSDNALWHRWFDGAWHSWESLGGTLTSAPAAASPSSGRVDVFVRGTDNALWQLYWSNGWHGWFGHGGTVTSDPAADSPGPGQLDVWVRGTDNGLWWKTLFNGSWYGYAPVGGTLTSAPTVSSWGNGRRDIVVRGTDNGWWHRSLDGTWSAWDSLGTTLTTQPAAASWAVNRIDVFAVNAAGQAADRWYG